MSNVLSAVPLGQLGGDLYCNFTARSISLWKQTFAMIYLGSGDHFAMVASGLPPLPQFASSSVSGVSDTR